MTEKKITFTSCRNHEWKEMKVETKNVNKLSINVPMDNNTEPNELIYAGMKLICDKICIPLGNLKKNTKPGWEIRLERQIKKLWQQVKVLRKEKLIRIC